MVNVCCVVALILGMLMFHMLKNVCGCNVVEGNDDNCFSLKEGGCEEISCSDDWCANGVWGTSGGCTTLSREYCAKKYNDGDVPDCSGLKYDDKTQQYKKVVCWRPGTNPHTESESGIISSSGGILGGCSMIPYGADTNVWNYYNSICGNSEICKRIPYGASKQKWDKYIKECGYDEICKRNVPYGATEHEWKEYRKNCRDPTLI